MIRIPVGKCLKKTSSTTFKDGREQVLADRIIRRLMRAESLTGFTNDELFLILEASKILLTPIPCMVELTAPVVIFGDTHGQFSDLLRFLRIVGTPPKTKLLFLGDYVDRGKMSLEIIMLLLCFKIRFPDRIELLRGNHETMKMNRGYGFYDEMIRKRTAEMWREFQEVFNEMPLCALISQRILAMHGGISPHIDSWDTLKKVTKPKTPRDCDSGIQLDLMWSDPSRDCCGFQANKQRSASYIFGEDSIKQFCVKMKIDMIVRAHEMVTEGHDLVSDHLLCTVFSAPNYCGSDKNSGSVMEVSADLEISFESLKPRVNVSQLPQEKLRLLERMALVDNSAKSPNPQSRKSSIPPVVKTIPKNFAYEDLDTSLGGESSIKEIEIGTKGPKEPEKIEFTPPNVQAPPTTETMPTSDTPPTEKGDPANQKTEPATQAPPTFLAPTEKTGLTSQVPATETAGSGAQVSPTSQVTPTETMVSGNQAPPTEKNEPVNQAPPTSQVTPTETVVPGIQATPTSQAPPTEKTEQATQAPAAPETIGTTPVTSVSETPPTAGSTTQAPPTSSSTADKQAPMSGKVLETNL